MVVLGRCFMDVSGCKGVFLGYHVEGEKGQVNWCKCVYSRMQGGGKRAEKELKEEHPEPEVQMLRVG